MTAEAYSTEWRHMWTETERVQKEGWGGQMRSLGHVEVQGGNKPSKKKCQPSSQQCGTRWQGRQCECCQHKGILKAMGFDEVTQVFREEKEDQEPQN